MISLLPCSLCIPLEIAVSAGSIVVIHPTSSTSRVRTSSILFWAIVVGCSALATISAHYLLGWSWGSSDLFLISLGSLLFLWLIPSLFLSAHIRKGLLAAILVALGCVGVSQHLRNQERLKMNRFFAMITQNRGLVSRRFDKPASYAGWVSTTDGLLLPSIIEPFYLAYSDGEIIAFETTASLLRKEDLECCEFAHNFSNHLISLTGEHCDPEGLVYFCQQLQSPYVKIEATSLSDSDTNYVSHARGIKEVQLHLINPSPDDLKHVPALELKDITLSHLQASHSLHKILSQSLMGVGRIVIVRSECEAELFRALDARSLPWQIELHESMLSEEAWDTIPTLSNLASLHFIDCPISDEHLAKIASNPGIEGLSVVGAVNQISNSGVAELSRMTQLRKLSLHGQISREAITAICQSCPLEFLSVESPDLDRCAFGRNYWEGNTIRAVFISNDSYLSRPEPNR